MTQTFPPKPWSVDDTFTNDETGVVYTYTGEQWVAAGGPEVEGVYLPLVGGTLSDPGNLTVEGTLKVDKGSDFRVQYTDDTSMIRVQPNQNNIVLKAGTINTNGGAGALNGRAALELQVHGNKPFAISHSGTYQSTFEIYRYVADEPGGRGRSLWIGAQGNINTDGNVNAKDFVKGSELRSTKLTSGQNSNLEIHRGSGDTEERKMLIGDNSVNFDVDIKLVGTANKDIIVKNGTKMYTTTENGEIITFGGSGAFYRGSISQDDHLINKGYADALVEDGPFLPLTGGDVTGATTISNGNQVALTIKNGNQDKIKFWGSGAVALVSGYTAFKDDELITKKYADDADATLVAKAGSTMTGALTVQRSGNQLFVGKKDNSTTCEIYADGTFQTTKTSFSDNNLVTKKYVDDTVASSGGGFSPGQKVAKDNSTGVEVGGFYINNGNLYVKLS